MYSYLHMLSLLPEITNVFILPVFFHEHAVVFEHVFKGLSLFVLEKII